MDMADDELYFNDDMEMDGQEPISSDVEIENKPLIDFRLKPEILKAIDGIFQYASEVDAMQGKDILCQARAGSGKATLSVLAILHQLNEFEPGVYVIVVCPTRQLVTKVLDCYKIVSKHMPLVKIDTFGQKAGSVIVITGVHIALGTPGRVSRAIRNRKIDFSHIKHLVLYEADKMLSTLDMRNDVEEVCNLLPQSKQILMFSEKFSKEVRQICKGFLQQPLKVFVDDDAKYISLNLDQFYIKVTESSKYNKLLEILQILQFSLIIVYVKSPVLCETITNLLKQSKLSAACYHLGMKLGDRRTSITHFKKLKKRILVVAKVLEADVNIDEVNVVINYDKPEDVDLFLKYVTPASKSIETKGLTITFLPEDDDMKMIQELEDWYSASFSEFPSKIQLEVTSYNCSL